MISNYEALSLLSFWPLEGFHLLDSVVIHDEFGPGLAILYAGLTLQVFRSKIGSWRKALRQRAEFVFVDAPFLVEGEEKDVQLSGGAQEGPRRAWWQWQVCLGTSN